MHASHAFVTYRDGAAAAAVAGDGNEENGDVLQDPALMPRESKCHEVAEAGKYFFHPPIESN